MKLHLPTSLRKALITVFAAVCAQPVTAAVYSGTIGQTLYTDFADNCGLYSTHNVNAMLTAVRTYEGGIYIYYKSEKYPQYKLPEDMISFESQNDGGYAAGVGYNYLATVAHNGVIDPTFSTTKVGDSNAIRYSGIEYRSSEGNTFLLSPNWDYKLTRLSKIVTDVTMSDPNTGAFGENWGRMLYRSGSGTMNSADENGNWTWMAGGYSFNLGGMMSVDSSYRYHNGTDVRGVVDDSGFFTVTVGNLWKASDDPTIKSPINQNDPMPFSGLGGDSGSPTWFWNSDTNSYVYAGALVGGDLSSVTYIYYAPQWTVGTMDYFNSKIELEGAQHTLYINAVTTLSDRVYKDTTNKVETQLYTGNVTDGSNTLGSFVGVQKGKNTWKDLSPVKDNLAWYTYGGEGSYLNATNDSPTPSTKNVEMTYADLFYTENLVFEAQDGTRYDIKLNDTVDTGIGYTQFSKLAEVDKAQFYLSAATHGSQLNTAGFVVDEGVELHMQLTGDADYMREWRKTGAGELYIEGNGNNEILLNLGGSGTTYLARSGGYAAYNVLASSGTTVVIDGDGQIKRDFTFGNGGATLDMNGHSMELWDANSAKEKANTFSIHALTQESIITNNGTSNVELTWKSGDTESKTFLASFVDGDKEGSGTLRFIYDSADTLKLNSIYTKLTKDGSGITVKQGNLALEGSLTVHAPGSASISGNSSRLVNNEDWHYADMETPVTVEGGTFELSHHARLTGAVTVKNNGTFLVRESVAHQMEYIEGSYEKFDTDIFKDYFGHHGSVNLADSGTTMKIEFHDGVDSKLVYGNSISGAGRLVVDSGDDGGIIEFSADTTGLTGQKTVAGGGLVITSSNALGCGDSKWEIQEKGWLSVEVDGVDAARALQHISSESNGVFALTANVDSVLDTKDTPNLFIGVAMNKKVNYGTHRDELKVNAQNEWRLGGGGGELVVNAKLAENGGKLVLGNQYTSGTVTLTNTDNQIGYIEFVGRVTLNYDAAGALGGAQIHLGYANRIMGRSGIQDRIDSSSSGVILMDNMSPTENLDISALGQVYLGANKDMSYMGNLNIGSSDTYRFGGGAGILSVLQSLTDNAGTSRNLIVDGQTYSGGGVKLVQKATLTGTVTVQGYDEGKGVSHTGDTTLSFSSSNALLKASSTTVKDGGRIDLGGTSQTFNNLVVQAGGMVLDANKNRSGVLSVVMSSDLSWNGTVDVGKVVVSGMKTLTLYGKALYDEMRIQSGSQVTLGAHDTLSAAGTTYIENGATLNANGIKTAGKVVVEGTLNATDSTFSGIVELREGTLNISKGTLSSDSTLFAYGGNISGLRATLASDSHFMEGVTTFDAGEYGTATHAKISGNVEIAKDAVLQLKYGEQMIMPVPVPTYAYLEYDMNAAEFNTSESGGGTLFVETNRLYLTGGDQTFGGIFKVGNKNDTKINGSSGLKTIDNLQLTGGTAQFTGNASWSIGNITGNGNLSVNTADKLTVTGKSDWTGQLTKSNSGTLVVSGEKALQAASVQLSDTAQMELDNDKVQLGALNGSSGTSIQAGEHVRAGESAILEIMESGNFAGSVNVRKGDSEAESYVSLLMNGSTFTMSGSQMTFKDVTVQSGTLAFGQTSLNLQILDSINIALGSRLEIAKGLELTSGQTLRVMASAGGSTQAATLTGDLTLNGGALSFTGAAMNAGDGALLDVGGNITYGDTETLVVNFTDTGDIQVDKKYRLSGSDWSGIDSNTISTNLEYLRAEFTTGDNELSVTFQMKEGSRIWAGTESAHHWNCNAFGPDEALGSNMQAVFTNTAACKEVNVTETVTTSGLVFDSSDKYTVAASGSCSLTAGKLVQNGSGTTELGNGIIINGTASVKAGGLVLEKGSRVESVTMADNTSLHVKDRDSVRDAISGNGAVVMEMEATQTFDLSKLKSSYSLELAGTGRYDSSTGAVHTGRMTVKQGATLALNGAALNTGGGTVVLGGNLEMVVGQDAVLSQNLEADIQIITQEGKEEEIIETRGNIIKTGAGALTIQGNVTANRVEVTGGSVTVGQDSSFDVALLDLQQGTVTMQKDAKASKAIGSMTMGDSTTFVLVNATETSSSLALTSLKLKGSNASLEQRNNVGGIRIVSLQQDGVESGTLNLVNNTSSNKVALFELGTAGPDSGHFNGDIRLVNASSASSRSSALVVSNGDMAADARIDMSSVQQTGIKMALGLNDDYVKIAGLSSSANLADGRAVVFSGSVSLNSATNISVFDGDGATRNLEIAARGDNTFYGSIGSGINISVKGSGTQAFMGASGHFVGSLSVGDSATLVIGSAAADMLAQASMLTVTNEATLQTESTVTLNHDASLGGTLAMGGTVTTNAKLALNSNMNIILGGINYTQTENTRTYDVFVQSGEGQVIGWDALNNSSFGGFGSSKRGVVITKLDEHDGRYQVQVDMNNIKNAAITWSEDVAVGTWDSDSANFTENGERTAYYDGDTVTIATDATIVMGQAVNLQNTDEQPVAGTLNVAAGANASVSQTADKTLRMNILHVKDSSEFTINSVADNFADSAIVESGSTLNVRFGATLADSGAVKAVTGGGTLRLVNTNGSGLYDLGDNELSGETHKIDLSNFAGTLELGNDSTQIRLRDDRLGVLNKDATVVVHTGAQFWKTTNGGNSTALDNGIILRGNSGAAAGNSKDGFGAVRGATAFNGMVTIEGNAMVSGAGSIAFNGGIQGMGDNDTLTFGCYYGGQASQTYTLSAGMQTEDLANMVVRQSGSNGTTTVNVNSAEGLAEKLAFADGVGHTKAVVNVNASNSIQRLESTAGNGVVNIAAGKALTLAQGADYGGQLKLAEDVTFTANDKTATAKVNGFVKFESAKADYASITGADGTRIENTLIDLAVGTRLEMANVTLGADSCITDDNAILVANGLTMEADILSNLKPLTYGDTVPPPPQEEPAGIVSYTLSNIQDVSIEGKGSGLVVCMVGSSSQVLNGANWLRLGLAEGDLMGEFVDGLAVTLQYEDATGQQRSAQGVYSWEDVEVQAAVQAAAQNHDYVYFRLTGTVPEPTTGTLSLLALAALTARRRRK